MAISTTNAPTARWDHTAVWTGIEMIVWGGWIGSYSNTGGRYDPGTDSWTATSPTKAPTARSRHTAVWTGSEMIVWGGRAGNYSFNTGGKYCGQYTPSLTIIQPNGGEVWAAGSVYEIKWDSTALKHSDHLIIQYSRNGGASWLRIAQNVPALSFSYSWHVNNYSTTQGRVKILLQGIVDHRPERRQLHCRAGRKSRCSGRNGGKFSHRAEPKHPLEPTKPRRQHRRHDYTTDNGTTWIRIATQAEDTGWYLWNVPGPATTAAQVRIRYHETPSVTDTSDAVFTIVE
jgi:hypothetical protein